MRRRGHLPKDRRILRTGHRRKERWIQFGSWNQRFEILIDGRVDVKHRIETACAKIIPRTTIPTVTAGRCLSGVNLKTSSEMWSDESVSRRFFMSFALNQGTVPLQDFGLDLDGVPPVEADDLPQLDHLHDNIALCAFHEPTSTPSGTITAARPRGLEQLQEQGEEQQLRLRRLDDPLPDQNESQTRSICPFSAPVITQALG